MKRFLVFMIAICMLFESVPMTAMASESSKIAEETVAEEKTGEEPVAEEETEEETVTEEETKEETVTEEETEEESVVGEETEEEPVTEEEAEEVVAKRETMEIEEEFLNTYDAEPYFEAQSPEELKTKTESEVKAQYVEIMSDELEEEVIELDVGVHTLSLKPMVRGESTIYPQWYSFTAPEDGFYNFHVDKIEEVAYFSLHKNYGDQHAAQSDTADWVEAVNLRSGKMCAGETIYLRAYTVMWETHIINLEVEQIKSYEMIQQNNGIFVATSDQYTLSANLHMGYQFLVGSTTLQGANGYSLSADYKLDAICAKKNVEGQTSETLYLYSWNSYTESFDFAVYGENEYDVYFVLENRASGRVEGVFSVNKVWKPQSFAEGMQIYDIRATDLSISFYMESFVGGCCYYAPVNSSGDVQYKGVSYGRGETIFENLQPGTEYWFEFRDGNNGIIYKTIASTTNKVNLNAAMVTKGHDMYLELTASVSGYTEEQNFSLAYTYTDALGNKIEGWNNLDDAVISKDANTITHKVVDNSGAILAGETYSVVITMRDQYKVLGKKVVQVTAPATTLRAEDIQFTVTPNETNTRQVKVSFSVKNLAYDAEVALYHKQEWERQYWRSTDTISKDFTSYSGTYSFSNEECIHEYVLVVGGVKKECSVDLGPAAIQVEKVGEGETNAIDFVRTYKIVNPVSESYTMYLMYERDDGYNARITDEMVLNAENGYQATFKTADTDYKLLPNSDYSFIWFVKDGNGKYLYFNENVHTDNLDLTIESTSSGYNNHGIKISLGEQVTKNFTNFPYLALYPYIREAGTTTYYAQNYMSFSKNSFSDNHTFEGLKENTAYEVSIRGENGVECATYTFTTPTDPRVLNANVTEQSLFWAELQYTLTGASNSMEYILCYLKEAGSDEWEAVAYDYTIREDKSATFRISNYQDRKLRAGTTYEYVIGLASNEYCNLENLEKTVSGQFTTLEDKREVSDAVQTGYSWADVSILFANNFQKVTSYVYFFYKEAAEDTWNFELPTCTSAVTKEITKNFKDLEAGTTYDYVIVITDKCGYKSLDEIEEECRKQTGQFTTKKSEYVLEFVQQEDKTTCKSASFLVQAKGCTADESIDVEVELNHASDPEYQGQIGILKLERKDDYIGELSFEGLNAATEYVIGQVDVYVTEDGNSIQIGTQECNQKFRTKDPQVPESIVLSEEEVTLNAIYYPICQEGYNSKGLSLQIYPETADKEIYWRTSDANIATVTREGTILAKDSGQAVITAVSAYDKSVQDSCVVNVKNYRIGYMDEEGNVQVLDEMERFSLYRGRSLQNLGFYEKDSNGEYTLLSDYNVIPSKEGIVTWEDGKLVATGIGETKVDFEKDGVRAALYVEVTAEGKGFGITGFSTSEEAYPSIPEKDGSYTLVLKDKVTYQAIGKISPKQPFHAKDFQWNISNPEIATVSEEGIITPIAEGTVTLTVVPKEENLDMTFVQEQVSVTLQIRKLQSSEIKEEIYVLSNVSSKLKDVAFPESWEEGWSWKYPNTPLVTNGANRDNWYEFEAVYRGTEGYPEETFLRVNIGKITGVEVKEEANAHNHVMEVGGNDSLTLTIEPICQGTVQETDYSVDIPAVKGLTFEKNEDGTITVTAQKAGKYTLKPIIKSGEKVIARTNYKIQAVKKKQVASIRLSTDTAGVSIRDNKVIFESPEVMKDFTLYAEVRDREGNLLETGLKWKSSDKNVVKVSATSKKEKQTGKVSVKGVGNATIQVKANDATGYGTRLDVEIRDNRPRLDTTQVTINTAYNYESVTGRELASKNGMMEIVPVYGESIRKVTLLDENAKEAMPGIRLSEFGEYGYLAEPLEDTLEAGVYNCVLRVTTDGDEHYDYSVKLSVVREIPTVTVKMSQAINLFYKNGEGIIDITTPENIPVEAITWEDRILGENVGFSMEKEVTKSGEKYISTIRVTQQEQLQVTDGNLTDPFAKEGTLHVRLEGYRESCILENFTIKCSYEKPVLVTHEKSSTIVPSMGQNKNQFELYDKTNNCYLVHAENVTERNQYDQVTCDNAHVSIDSVEGQTVIYSYTGEKQKEKITLQVKSSLWRENLETSHTIKVVKPKVSLSEDVLTYNSRAESTQYTQVCLNGGIGEAEFTDIVIKGKNKKSQKLLDNDLFVISSSGNQIKVMQSDASMIGQSLPAGTYTYKVTPYYRDGANGEKKALNNITLKIKVLNKEVKANITPKGKLDLSKGAMYSLSPKKNVVTIQPKFKNMAGGYRIKSARLVGEYSRYFTCLYEDEYYLTIAAEGVGKLKSGHPYKLAVEYTIETTEGESFCITSNTFTIKPIQSKPKVTVKNNNQTLYAAAEDLYRNCQLSVPEYYKITEIFGELDCNKDGKADIVVSGDSVATLKIADCNAIVATKSGKMYAVPVTVRLEGRDGIKEDIVVQIKFKVKK